MDEITKGKYKIWGVVLAFLAVFFLAFVFIIYPIIRGIVYNSDEIQKKIIDNEINQAGIGKISEMQKTHQLFVQKQDTLGVLINSGEEVSFIKKIEDLAGESGNKIELKIENKEVSPKKEEKTKDPSIAGSLPYGNSMIMEITLFGGYDGLIKFLAKLEKFEKYANVIKIDLSKVEEVQNEENKNIFNSIGKNNSPLEIKKKELLKSIIRLAVYIKK